MPWRNNISCALGRFTSTRIPNRLCSWHRYEVVAVGRCPIVVVGLSQRKVLGCCGCNKMMLDAEYWSLQASVAPASPSDLALPHFQITESMRHCHQ
jgi:hypothetical protein